MIAIRPFIAVALFAAAAAAQAHVTLDVPRAAAGAPYQAVLRINHGCEGSATHTVRVRLPVGFRGAKPMPKPGWALSLQRAPLAEPYESHGKRVTEDVVEITWRATSREAWLADAHFDEFVLRGSAPLQTGPAWFDVLQLCEQGQWDWSQRPREGSDTKGLKAPAVKLDVLPADPHAGHH